MIPTAQQGRGATNRVAWLRGYRFGRLERVRGEQAWFALAVLVVGYELLAAPGELLSEAVDRFIERHPVLARTAILLVAAHLCNALPDRVDPIHLLAVALRERE